MYNKLTYTMLALLIMVIAVVSFMIYQNEAAKNNVYKVVTEDGYEITNQEMVEAKIKIDTDDLSDDLDLWKIIDILSEIENDHIISDPVFESGNTKIYLESLSMATEDAEIITATFDISYEIPANGDVLYMETVGDDVADSKMYLVDGNVYDENNVYEAVLTLTSYGLEQIDENTTDVKFTVDMPVEVYNSCVDEIEFSVMLNQISYEEN